MEPLRRNLSGGVQGPQRTYICHIYICIHISQTYIDAEFDVESFGMVYLASKGRLGKVICEKHTFLNSPLPSTVRVSPHRPRPRPSHSPDTQNTPQFVTDTVRGTARGLG